MKKINIKQFGFNQELNVLRDMDRWIRHRLRSYNWHQCPKVRTRYKMLIKFGIGQDLALQTAASGKGAWRVSNSPALSIGFTTKYFDKVGLPRLYMIEILS